MQIHEIVYFQRLSVAYRLLKSRLQCGGNRSAKPGDVAYASSANHLTAKQLTINCSRTIIIHDHQAKSLVQLFLRCLQQTREVVGSGTEEESSHEVVSLISQVAI